MKLIMPHHQSRDPFVVLGCVDVGKLALHGEFRGYIYKADLGCGLKNNGDCGNLFGLAVYVDPMLEKDEAIFFNAGNHQQTVKLSYRDFKELVKPVAIPLAAEEKMRAA